MTGYLCLAVAGLAGLAFLRRGEAPVGRTLIGYMCVSAVGAGMLFFSTHAYLGALLQAAPAAAVLVLMVRAFSNDASSTAFASRPKAI